jgi:hypothetical protein
MNALIISVIALLMGENLKIRHYGQVDICLPVRGEFFIIGMSGKWTGYQNSRPNGA